MADSVALRVQEMSTNDRTLVLAEIVEARSGGRFSPASVEAAFHEFRLPISGRVSNTMARLEADGALVRGPGRGAVWAVTPRGRERARSIIDEQDVALLVVEVLPIGSSIFGATRHPLLPPVLAPPAVAHEVAAFTESFPFETNIFGMTRFPSEEDSDSLKYAIEAARAACSSNGLRLWMASDGNIVDDLWPNVMAYMWACKYGIAFFEDIAMKGINHNMSIEVGSMMMAGRRCALLKDSTVEKLPTDLVGKIYRSVDMQDPATVHAEVADWINSDLMAPADTSHS